MPQSPDEPEPSLPVGQVCLETIEDLLMRLRRRRLSTSAVEAICSNLRQRLDEIGARDLTVEYAAERLRRSVEEIEDRVLERP